MLRSNRQTGPAPEDLKLARRHSRKAGPVRPASAEAAFWQSFVMLRPDIQWKNPVMFVVEVGTVLTLIYTVAKIVGVTGMSSAVTFGYLLVAGLLAGLQRSCSPTSPRPLPKPAARPRPTPCGRPASHARPAAAATTARIEETVSTDLKAGDLVEVVAGQLIPSDGEIIEGVASIDESAITGESAPVIREAGGDRSGVTGGTRVLSDRIVVEITASAGQSFLDRMIALVEGAIRQRTPNEIALSLVLAAFTLIFLIVTAALWPMAHNAEVYMQSLQRRRQADPQPGHRRADARRPAGLPDSDDHRRPAGRHRHRRHGPGPAGEHHRQERQGGRSGRRRRHAALGQDRHDHHRQSPRDAVRALWRHTRPARSASLAALASVADETPEGKSIVELYCKQDGATAAGAPRLGSGTRVGTSRRGADGRGSSPSRPRRA